MEKINKVFLKKADCSLDLGDGSERGLYVNQDYILQKLHRLHRGISLMYTYYPKDKGWPNRASDFFGKENFTGPWSYPYEDYFPYQGGVTKNTDGEPFKSMREIRSHGQDVVLTITMDPTLEDKYIIEVAKDLRPYGRVLLRINHECTGNWFCFTQRCSYQQIADFFVRCCKIFHKHSPNVKMILCAGMYDKETEKIEMEDIFLQAYKEADYWSGDQYLSLHWGWPQDVALKGGKNFACYDVDEVYEKAKNTWKRLCKITGQKKEMLLSELNSDGDVTGPFEQARMMKHFMALVQKDSEHWLSGFAMYQFRDDGRLGLEITDPNNSEVGIEQPLLLAYREESKKDFFTQKIIFKEEANLPVSLRWGNADDSEGIEFSFHVNKNPHYAELYFNTPELAAMNLIIELDGHWFYKKPGTKCVDLMSKFYNKPAKGPEDYKIRIFAPPADGMNKAQTENSPETSGNWIFNYYSKMESLPKLRLEEEPVQILKEYCD